jgi:hypothetical protein
MSGKKIWLKTIVLMLAIMLLPFAPFAGLGIPEANAEGEAPINIFVFGANDDTSVKLVLEEEEIFPSDRVSGNGIVQYVFIVDPDEYYELYINSEQMEVVSLDYQRDYVYHLNTSSDYIAELYQYDLIRDGDSLSGRILFFGGEERYRLTFLNPQGTLLDVCMAENTTFFDWLEFAVDSCTIPSGADSLQIEAWIDDDEYVPTNAKLLLGSIGEPEVISVVDANPAPERAELTVRFRNKSESQSDIALYKLTTESLAFNDQYFYVLADKGGPYTVSLQDTEIFLEDWIVVNVISSSGHPYVETARFPLVDKIRDIGNDGPIDFDDMACETVPSTYYCNDMMYINDSFEPSHAKFMNGTVSWTVPNFDGDLNLVAYDIHFADEDKKHIESADRVYLLADPGSTFTYTLSDIPENAKHLAVVTVLIEYVDDGYIKYYTDPFYISMDPSPPLDESLLPSGLIRIEEGVYGYIPTGMRVMDLLEDLSGNVWSEVWIEGPDRILGWDEPILPGSKLNLKSSAGVHELELLMLSDLLRQGSTDPITLKRIVEYVVLMQADVTGDGRFDSADARRLIRELEQ